MKACQQGWASLNNQTIELTLRMRVETKRGSGTLCKSNGTTPETEFIDTQ